MEKKFSSLVQFLTASPLRNRLILFFIVLATVPVLILGSVSIYLIDLSHRQDVSSLELRLLSQKKEEVEKFFLDTLGILELRTDIEPGFHIDEGAQEFLLKGFLEENNAFEGVSFISTEVIIDNKIVVVGGKETAKKSRFQNSPEFLNVSQLPRYTEPITGRTFVGEVYYTLGGPLVTLAVPVRNKSGDIIHILTADVNLSRIVNSIENTGLGTSGYVLLFDRNGSLIARGRGVDTKPGTSFFEWPRLQSVLAGQQLDALGDRDRYESFFSTSAVVGAGRQIPDLGWVLLVEWPIEDADVIIRDIRDQVLFLTIFSIFAVILIAIIFAARLVRPIHKLEDAARAIEKGEFKGRVDIKTGDELEELGHQFNKMAKGLKRLQELRDEFVFVAAHEIRSPVTVIKGYISMVLEGDAGKISPEVKDFLGKAQTANERLLKLVFDLLEVARSEAGRLVIETKPLEIREPIRQSVDELQSLADEKSITLSYEQPKELPLVLGDNDRIKEIMVNLAGNAIKYTAEGGWVKVFHEVKGGYVITHIQDNGFGMSRDAQKKLFQKFYRVKTEETREIGGTGLGLFIVKELVEKMKGKTSVVSEKGKGSTFSFTLPVSQGTLSIKNSSTSTAPEAKPRTGKEKRIDSQGKAG